MFQNANRTNTTPKYKLRIQTWQNTTIRKYKQDKVQTGQNTTEQITNCQSTNVKKYKCNKNGTKYKYQQNAIIPINKRDKIQKDKIQM